MGKIAYIGHSFHEKTGSTVFFIELLRKHFDVEVIPNDSWTTGALPEVKHLDDSYDAVVLFQLVSKELLDAISTRNVVYIPMADYVISGIDRCDSGLLSFRSYSFWEMLAKRGVKILNFSEWVHHLCVNLGMRSRFVQYYPAPAESPDFGGDMSVFYWERVDSISPKTVKTLIGGSATCLHHHRAHDPGQCKDASTRECNPFAPMAVTTSTWFADKEDYLRHVAEKSIYIAPRRFEGIGMSFLEAMAMGKAVVAPDYPTMNEYIRHSLNGYLFDFQNPKSIDFSDISMVRKNAYESVVRGYEKWLSQSESLVDWIRQPCEERRQAVFIDIFRDLGISPQDSPNMNVRTLEYILEAEPKSEPKSESEPKTDKKNKGGGFKRILRSVGRTTLGDLFSLRFWVKKARKLLRPVKRAVVSAIGKNHESSQGKGSSSEQTVAPLKAASVAANAKGAVGTPPVIQEGVTRKKETGAGLKVVVSSNCQTAGIASALQLILPGADIEALPIALNIINDENKPRFKKALSRADFWITISQPELLQEWNYKHVKPIRVPGLMFRAFHPDLVYARNTETNQLIPPIEHYNSLIVLWSWMQGFSVEEAKKAFNERLLHELGYMDMWDVSYANMKSAFSGADIDFKRFFAHVKRMGMFMHSINHPIQPALSAIAMQAAEIIEPGCRGADPALCDSLTDPLRHSIWPLYPPIAEAMSLPGSYSWMLSDRHYPNLASFIEYSYSIYASEGINAKNVKFEFIPVESQLKILENEYGRGK
jgi:glycosyltransferase involved in cell wall biosynthesis